LSKHTFDISLSAVTVDRESTVPLVVQLYRGLRDAIVSRQIAPGVRLPSTRTLAAELAVSRNTVLDVYDQLYAEGYVEGRVGAGTYVVSVLSDVPAVERRGGRAEVRAAPRAETLSHFGEAVRGLGLRAPGTTSSTAFALGAPDVTRFPANIWSRLTARRLRHGAANLLTQGSPAGYRPLREAIAEYLGTTRGVRCEPDQVIVVAGTQRGLSLVTRVLLEPGDPVWMEDPGYPGAGLVFRAAGLQVEPVPVDREGLSVAEGIARAPDARAAYVTPSNQFPMSVTMSATRRLSLLDWAHRNDAWIVEDDYDSEFRYAGRPLAALQGLDQEGRVIYLGTFSKMLFPALRLAYVVVPTGLADVVCAAQVVETGFPPTVDQAVLTDFLFEGHFARHVRTMRSIYAERQEVLRDAVRARLDGLLTVRASPAGIHLVGQLAEGIDDRAATVAAMRHGVRVAPLSGFFLGPSDGRRGLLLGYAAPDLQEIGEGVDRLAKALTGLSQNGSP
jgi:GntR family transcriptional regulator/MocR family aminotransferase